MLILGIESSCDECAAAIVEDGKTILSNVIATQIPFHEEFNGVVPEIASRKHTEWIYDIVDKAIINAKINVADIDAVAVTAQPGLLGSLLVGLSFAKSFAFALDIPFIAVNHMLAHLYAARLGENVAAYPFLGLLVSGGHTIICRVENYDTIEVLGTTIDDAVGEAFDKVSAHYGFGYPGGKYIDDLAKNGDSSVFAFPRSNLHKERFRGEHNCDVSYSGLKTAVVNQAEQFRKKGEAGIIVPQDIAASFQKAAVDILLHALFNAVESSGLNTVVLGGGVAANSYLRECLQERKNIKCIFPPLELCGDNGAMVAGIGFEYIKCGSFSMWSLNANARVSMFKRKYP
ncbi:MAG: tRNA (adenosine(37)-N6)-threonylcarbamoyltransferase complex transferase subunit TsaD [Termitinemataceae bacterium]|nr:MAG: tRNA (adenosine(37)-N6)-threonylcarbamoyltransferase complex transferase subunit TsaD [Termitinemataceae bacterium]